MVRYIVYWTCPAVHLLLGDLANDPLPEVILDHLVVGFELVLLDEAPLDPGFDGEDLLLVVLQNLRVFEIRILEI